MVIGVLRRTLQDRVSIENSRLYDLMQSYQNYELDDYAQLERAFNSITNTTAGLNDRDLRILKSVTQTIADITISGGKEKRFIRYMSEAYITEAIEMLMDKKRSRLCLEVLTRFTIPTASIKSDNSINMRYLLQVLTEQEKFAYGVSLVDNYKQNVLEVSTKALLDNLIKAEPGNIHFRYLVSPIPANKQRLLQSTFDMFLHVLEEELIFLKDAKLGSMSVAPNCITKHTYEYPLELIIYEAYVKYEYGIGSPQLNFAYNLKQGRLVELGILSSSTTFTSETMSLVGIHVLALLDKQKETVLATDISENYSDELYNNISTLAGALSLLPEHLCKEITTLYVDNLFRIDGYLVDSLRDSELNLISKIMVNKILYKTYISEMFQNVESKMYPEFIKLTRHMDSNESMEIQSSIAGMRDYTVADSVVKATIAQLEYGLRTEVGVYK